jgi:sialic acid synthase SpsE
MSVYIVSEICGQWGGSVRKAEQMILQSKMMGADAVKVQLFDTYKLPGEGRERWEYLSMTKDDFHRLADFCEKLNIDFFASAFDRERFGWIKRRRAMNESSIKVNKIASSLIELDPALCKEMIESGMTNFFSLGKWNHPHLPFENNNVVYFHCLAKYPHTTQEALAVMPSSFDGRVVGYSDHAVGNDAAKEAVRRGAKYIEKHFSLDKTAQCSTESAHLCSMDARDLEDLRRFCDSAVRR